MDGTRRSHGWDIDIPRMGQRPGAEPPSGRAETPGPTPGRRWIVGRGANPAWSGREYPPAAGHDRRAFAVASNRREPGRLQAAERPFDRVPVTELELRDLMRSQVQ